MIDHGTIEMFLLTIQKMYTDKRCIYQKQDNEVKKTHSFQGIYHGSRITKVCGGSRRCRHATI